MCLIRDQPHYRRWAFEQGIRRAGHKLVDREPCDALVIWNRYGTNEQLADKIEAQGGIVLVAENGYFGNDFDNRQFYALAQGGHNGNGRWVCGLSNRWDRFGVDFADWRVSGDEIVICPQRGIGPNRLAQPREWGDDVARRLRRITTRPVRIRPHPGNQKPVHALERDLASAHAVVVWNSNCATTALIMGIPVFYEGPAIVTGPACNRGIENINIPEFPDRAAAFERMAWAQWSVADLESGEPFALLLREPEENSRAAN